MFKIIKLNLVVYASYNSIIHFQQSPCINKPCTRTNATQCGSFDTLSREIAFLCNSYRANRNELFIINRLEFFGVKTFSFSPTDCNREGRFANLTATVSHGSISLRLWHAIFLHTICIFDYALCGFPVTKTGKPPKKWFLWIDVNKIKQRSQ